MALKKREFVNLSKPPIDADFLNELQDAVIDLEENGGGGSGTGAVEITESDYENLTEEEKNADVLYMISDKAKIYYKGKEYSGVPSSAENIAYDDTLNVKEKIEEVEEKVNTRTSPYLYTDWTNGTTTSNTSWVEKMGNLVIVHLVCSCIAYNKPTLMSGLPKPKSNMYQYLGTSGASSIVLNTNGVLAVASGGSASGVDSAIAGTFMYFTDY